MKLFAIAILLFASTSFAKGGRQATREEMKQLCNAVSYDLQQQESDVEVDPSCENGSARVYVSGSRITIKGTVATTWAGIRGFDKCSVTFRGEAAPEVRCN
jgi:hypothetical protein